MDMIRNLEICRDVPRLPGPPFRTGHCCKNLETHRNVEQVGLHRMYTVRKIRTNSTNKYDLLHRSYQPRIILRVSSLPTAVESYEQFAGGTEFHVNIRRKCGLYGSD